MVVSLNFAMIIAVICGYKPGILVTDLMEHFHGFMVRDDDAWYCTICDENLKKLPPTIHNQRLRISTAEHRIIFLSHGYLMCET